MARPPAAAVLLSGRTLARLLAPIASPVAATGAGRSLFFAMERSRPWQLPADDAGQLLLDFAQAPGYLEPVQAAMVDVPTRLSRITCPVLLLQGTADPLVSMQSPRFLAFVRHAQLQWLPGLSHVRSLMTRSLSPRSYCGSSRQRPEKGNTAEGCQHSSDPGSASRSRRRPAPVQTHHGETSARSLVPERRRPARLFISDTSGLADLG
jgi:hypothetical protein